MAGKHTPTKGMVAASKRGIEMTKKPELSNNDIPDVSMKGGKKIASGQQISDDHVRSMAEYHAGHMGMCPTGDDAEHADDLLWGGPAGASWAASRVAAMDATTLSLSDSPDLSKLLAGTDPFSIEVYSRRDLLGEKIDLKRGDDGLYWAPIIRSGTLAVRPDPSSPNGRKNEPLVFVKGHASNPKEIGLADLVDAFDAEAVPHVTIPKTHRNNEFENTGFIRKVKIADSTLRPGEQVILGGHEFLDPDAEQRIESGLIANRSCGILHGYQNTETGTVYPHVIEHVALTNKPWVTGMEAYGTDTFSTDRQIVPLMLSDGIAVAPPADPEDKPEYVFSTSTSREQLERELNLADIVWNDEDDTEPSLTAIQSQLYDALRTMGKSPYWDEESIWFSVRDVRPSSALVAVDYGGSDPEDAWVIPYSMQQGQLVLSDFSQWQVVHQAWVADDDANQDKTEIQQLMQQDTKLSRADAERVVATYLSVSAAERKKAKDSGDTMSDGSYPITNQSQADKAWNLRNNGKQPESAVVAHIRKQVKKHGLKMPGSSSSSSSKTNTSLPIDPLKRASMLRLSQEPMPTQHPGGNMTLSPELLARLDLSDEAREVLQREMTAEQAQRAAEQNELATYRRDTRANGAKERLTKLSEMGFAADSGFLAEVNTLLLADDGDVAVTLLSADGSGQKTNLTVTQVIDRLIAAFPKDDQGKINLATKTNLLENPLERRPDLKPDPADAHEGAKRLSGDEMLEQWKTAAPGIELSLPLAPSSGAPAPAPVNA